MHFAGSLWWGVVGVGVSVQESRGLGIPGTHWHFISVAVTKVLIVSFSLDMLFF